MTQHPELSDWQRQFVTIYVSTGGQNATQCAIAAGYSVNGAGVTAHRLLKRPNIIAAIRAETERVFQASAPVAAETIIYLARSAKNESVRLQAAEIWLNRAGMLLAAKSEHRHIIEDRRSDAELREHVARLARELGLDAKVIDGRAVIEALPALPAPIGEPAVANRVESWRELEPIDADATVSAPFEAPAEAAAPVPQSVPLEDDDDADPFS